MSGAVTPISPKAANAELPGAERKYAETPAADKTCCRYDRCWSKRLIRRRSRLPAKFSMLSLELLSRLLLMDRIPLLVRLHAIMLNFSLTLQNISLPV